MIKNNIHFGVRFIFTVLLLVFALPIIAQTKDPKEGSSVLKFIEIVKTIPNKTAVQDTILSVIPSNDSIIIVGKAKYILNQKSAHASYYADKFTGRRTASGKIFNNNEYTCAHRKLPFGTKLRVTCERTKKSVYVIVTDRGPFVRGRHIDLSKRSFFTIAPKSYGGSIAVTIEIVKELK